MAPRRGGGGSFGGGGSSIGDTPWGELIQLAGWHFRNSKVTAAIVFTAIGVVGTMVVIILAFMVKNKKLDERNRRLYKWFAFQFTIVTFFM